MRIQIKDFNDFGNKNSLKVSDELIAVINDIDTLFTENSARFRKEFRNSMTLLGYPNKGKLSPESNTYITTIKDNVGVCLQLGNVARAGYDLLKFGYFYNVDNSFQGIFICPNKSVGNRAGFDRVSNELENCYKDVIKLPIRVIGIGY